MFHMFYDLQSSFYISLLFFPLTDPGRWSFLVPFTYKEKNDQYKCILPKVIQLVIIKSKSAMEVLSKEVVSNSKFTNV